MCARSPVSPNLRFPIHYTSALITRGELGDRVDRLAARRRLHLARHFKMTSPAFCSADRDNCRHVAHGDPVIDPEANITNGRPSRGDLGLDRLQLLLQAYLSLAQRFDP